jgi:broad specificity phosphatase PhoE
MKLIIVRHGESHGNRLRQFESSDNFDCSHLTRTGTLQVKSLAEHLGDYRPVECIYSSPSVRTRETSEILRMELDSPITIVNELGEINCGEWAGHAIDKIAELNPREWKVRKEMPTEFCFPGGEGLRDVEQRVTPFIDGLFETSGRETILLVSHSTMISVILAYLCEWNLEQAWRDKRSYHPNSAFSILEFEARNQKLISMKLSNKVHLS